MEHPLKFKKEERIYLKKDIDLLFMEGQSFISYPLRVVFFKLEKKSDETTDNYPPVSILVSVSKKKFKHAVKRNRVKRLIRESYRLNKSIIYKNLEDKNYRILIGFIYVANDIKRYEEVEKATVKALNILSERLI